MIEIVKVDTRKRRDVTRFITMPLGLYRDCPYWVPPLWGEARGQLDRRRHPYYEHSDADFFVAVQDGRDVGRIAVLENRRYNEYRGERTGFFYLFDSVDDSAVSQALLRTAEDWAKGRGMTTMMGPKGFIAMDAFGVLVEGFGYLPAMDVPYNYEYYDRLIREEGYEKYTDVFSCYFAERLEIDQRIYKVAERVQKKRGITIKKIKNKKELIDTVPAVLKAYNDTFIENWEYVPVTEKEAQMVVSRLAQVLRPELMKLAMHGDKIVGFLIGYPNICQAIQKTGGRLWPFGFIRLLHAVKTSKRLDLNGVGILPEYQGSGAVALLYAEMARTVQQGQFEFAELVQMEEKNTRIQSELKLLGATFYKAHRIYIKELQP